MDTETLTCNFGTTVLGDCHQLKGLMPISNRVQDKRSDVAVHTHTHTHNIYTPCVLPLVQEQHLCQGLPLQRVQTSHLMHSQAKSGCLRGHYHLQQGLLGLWFSWLKGTFNEARLLLQLGIGNTLLVNCCTQINRYTQVLEINMICIVHLQSCTFKPQMVYTTPLVGGLIACILAVRVEPQISTVIHYYFYSTVVQILFKTKGTATHQCYARGSETTVIMEL